MGSRASSVRQFAGDLTVSIVDQPRAIEREWREFESTAVATAFQTFAWLDTWCSLGERVTNERPVIVVGRDAAGALAFILPMAVTTAGGLPALTWLAQRQNWYNMGLWRRDVMARITARDVKGILGHVIEVNPDVRSMQLLAQPESWAGLINPFKLLAHTRSPVQTFAFSCAPGSPAHDKLTGGRQHFAKKVRRLGRSGPVSFAPLTEAGSRIRALDGFFDWKAERLAALGLGNGFACAVARQFHRALALRERDGGLIVDTIQVGNDLVAVALSLRYQGRHYYLNNAFSSAPHISQHSPGLLVGESMFARCVEDGLATVDYGPGYSPEKATWHAEAILLFETFTPVSAASWVPTLGRRIKSNLIRRVRNTPELLSVARHLLRRLRKVQAARVPGVRS